MSFVEIHPDSDFSIANLPYGIFHTNNNPTPRIGVAVGTKVLDLSILAEKGLFDKVHPQLSNSLKSTTLNPFMSLGKKVWADCRNLLTSLLLKGSILDNDEDLRKKALIEQSETTMHLPCKIGNYTDFYSSLPHAYNVGRLLRGKGNELQPNYLHLPVGYHGRSSSIVVSNTDVRRPCGQIAIDPKDLTKGSKFSQCLKLDFELELGVLIGTGNELGEPININEAEEHIFGYVLLNDWSARDIQVFEYVPLGPFNAKNFCTTISPWVVTKQALDLFKAPTIYHPSNAENLKAVCMKNNIDEINFPPFLEYLKEKQDSEQISYDIKLTVSLKSEGMNTYQQIGESNYKNMYWTDRQQIAHHTICGCNLETGDLLGSGTISGYERSSYGSLLEMSNNGKDPLCIDKEKDVYRTFLQDGDTVKLHGVCFNSKTGLKVGFGECLGKVLPAKTKCLL